MSLSTVTRMSSGNSPSLSANSSSSAGPVLPSFAQTFSDLAGNTHTHARSSPEMQNTHSFHSDIDYSAERRDQDRDRERDRERERERDSVRDRTGREQDHSHSHSHTEHRSRLSSHNQDSVLPPILSHQDTHASNSRKRSLDDIRRDDDDREPERRQDLARDDRAKEGERRSPSQIKREPSLSPSPDHHQQQQHPSHHSRYLQQPHPTSHSHSYYPHHSPNSSNKRRKNNHELPPSPSDPSHNERDTEHSSSYSDPYSHAHTQTQRVTAQSNPSPASSSSSTTRTSPPMKRLSAIGSRANSLSPHQSANVIHHPQISSHNSSRSPNQAPLQPPPISKSPSQSHLRPPSQQPYQSSLLSSHFSMALPAPSDSFSTNRKKKLSAQYQGDISVPVPRPINTGSRSVTPTMATAGSGSGPGSAPTPGSASGPASISAPGVNASGSNTNHHNNNNNSNNSNIANNIVVASTTPSSLQPRGPPRHLTIAPHPRTRRLEPVIHSAPVNGGFFHGARNSNHSNRENMNVSGGSTGGVTIRSVGISSVRLHAPHTSSNNVEYNSTSSSLMASAPGTTAATANASTNSSLHPPVTPMRIPELPPIPITPNGRKNINAFSSSSGLMTSDNHLPHPYSRLPPPYSAGLLGRFDKETVERPSMPMSIAGIGSSSSSRFILDRERLEKDRERLILERDRSERDRGADVPIARNGGMRSGMVLGSINVPRTPLFSSFGQQQQPPASANAIANSNNSGSGGGVRSQQGRSVPSSSSTKFLQVPHTAGLNQSFSSSTNGTDAVSSSSSLHTAKHATTSNTTASTSSSNSSGATAITTTAALAATTNGSLSSSTDPKSSFLTLFSDFYDSLADSKLLKSWLHEQLVKSNTLIEHLEKAAATANGRVSNNGGGGGGSTLVGTLDSLGSSSVATTTITLTGAQLEDLIERRLGPVKNETEGLKRRVGELEEMVYEARKSGWGKRDNPVEVSKKRRRHEHEELVSSTVVVVPPPPVVSIRTSPPPPLVLTPSSVGADNVVIPRAPASAPLLLEDWNRHPGVPLPKAQRDMEEGVVGMSDKKKTRVASASENGSPPPPRSHPRSLSRTGTRTSTNGHDSNPNSISISKSIKSSEDDIDVDMDGRVNRTDDDGSGGGGDTHDREPVVAVSVPEHRTSAVRLES